MNHTINISKNFKQKTVKAIFSIIFFFLVYLLLLLAGVGLTVACAYGGFMLITSKFSAITLMLGLGLTGTGLLILFFLFKFIFTKSEKEQSHFIRIYEDEEPELFAFINNIVQQVDTSFPKKIYISHEVNASVFYNSSFWSMFFPVRKNLHIGLGLMNSVTTDEFKAIIAHEFGHFSQKSMKVGSYVYNVNQIIHNLLYYNDSYDKIINKWANISGYFALFTIIGVKVITGIQWVLQQVYKVVNINYMALSREMEFHADEVAANVAGPKPLETSLVRLNLASGSLTSVLNFYSEKIKENIRPSNIFPQQLHIMLFSSEEYNLPIVNGFPEVTLENQNRFDKSKLKFDNQWSSHPSDEDRIKSLHALNINIDETNNEPATTLLKNREQLEKKVTSKVFSHITYDFYTEIKDHSIDDFKIEYRENYKRNSFSKKYNNYFDDLTPENINLEELLYNIDIDYTEQDLFKNDCVDKVYDSIGLENDLQMLNRIASGEFKIKTFDFDGKRYKSKEVSLLIPGLEAEIKKINIEITDNNNKIFSYYYKKAHKSGKSLEYKLKYNLYNTYQNSIKENIELVNEIFIMTQFLEKTTTFEAIEANFNELFPKEKVLKNKIREVLENTNYKEILNVEIRDIFNKYISQNLTYFKNEAYNNENLDLFIKALNNYTFIIQQLSFKLKKDFLDFQAGLTENADTIAYNEKEYLN